MNPSELKELIDRYLKNNVTDEERKLVDDWYQSYDGAGYSLSNERTEQLDKEIYGYIQERLNPPTAKIKWLKVGRYAAAVATLLLTAGLLFRKNIVANFKAETFSSIKTGTGQIRKLELPDGSVVWLNAKTAIRVSDDFAQKTNRNIYLDEGEAFFEVTKNPSRPFFVITRSVTTRVLGTSFNVKAYRQLNMATVTVKTGRVQVNDKQRKLAVLQPHQQITYLTNPHKSYLTVVNADNSRKWSEGRTILKDVSFREVALALKNIYGVKVTSKNKLTATYKYNVIINHSRSIEQTMKVICSIHQNSFRRINNEVIIY